MKMFFLTFAILIIFKCDLAIADQPSPAKEGEYPNPSADKYRIVFRSTNGDIGDIEFKKMLKEKKGKKLGSYPDLIFYGNPDLKGEPVYELSEDGIKQGSKVVCENLVFCRDHIVRFYTDRANDYPNNYMNEVYLEFDEFLRDRVIQTTFQGKKLYVDISSVDRRFNLKGLEDWKNYGLNCEDKNKDCRYYYIHRPGRLIHEEFMKDHPEALAVAQYVVSCLEKKDMDCADKKSAEGSSIGHYFGEINSTLEMREYLSKYKNDLDIPGVVDSFKGCLLRGVANERSTEKLSKPSSTAILRDEIDMCSDKKWQITNVFRANVCCRILVVRRRDKESGKITSDIGGVGYYGNIEGGQ